MGSEPAITSVQLGKPRNAYAFIGEDEGEERSRLASDAPSNRYSCQFLRSEHHSSLDKEDVYEGEGEGEGEGDEREMVEFGARISNCPVHICLPDRTPDSGTGGVY